MPLPSPRLLHPALLALLATLLLWLLAGSLWTGIVAHWPGLFTDMWDEMPFLQRLDGGQSSAHDWLNAYAGSHRLLLPRTVFALEHRLFQHGNVFTSLVSLAFHVATLTLVCGMLIRHARCSTTNRHLLLATVLAAGVSGLHLYSLLYAFLVQWFQVVFFSLGGFALLVQAARLSGHRQVLVALAALISVLLAGFCTFAGVIALIALAWLALVLRGLPAGLRSSLILLCLLAVLLHALSLMSASTASGIGPGFILLPAVLLYTFRFLGTPLTLLWEPAGIALGAAIWLYTLGFAGHGLRKKPAAGLPLFALTGLLWLCGCAMAIALGRGSAPVTAIAERFHTLHLWLWPLWMLHLASLKPAWLHRWLPLPLVIFLCAVLLPVHQQALVKTLEQGQRVRLANVAYALNLRDWRTHALLSVPHKAAKQNPALDWRDYLIQTENGLFARPEAGWPDQRLPQRFDADCPQAVEYQPVSDTHALLTVSGPSLPERAWVVNADNRVIGYLRAALPTRPFQASPGLAGYSAREAEARLVDPLSGCVMARITAP